MKYRVVGIISFLAIFCLARFILIYNKDLKIESTMIIIPFLLDVIIGIIVVILAFMVAKKMKILGACIVFLFFFIQVGSMEYINALNSTIKFEDLHYLFDGDFIKGSFSISYPIYYCLLLSSSIYLVWLIYRRNIKEFSILYDKKLLISLVIVLFGLLFSNLNSTTWIENNFIISSIKSSVKPVKEIDVTQKQIDETLTDFYKANLISDGETVSLGADYSKKENILLVVLEGIPGSYIQEVQKNTNFDSQITLSSFDSIVQNSVIIPNFLTYNNQTIRGLYSIFSGKYPKLDSSTPKATEFLQSSEDNEMLPKILSDLGYNTMFMQAASLEFMNKDQFTRESGFKTILGKESMKYFHVPFGWGIDDKAFLEQSLEQIKLLDQQEKPWFTTLLTVGTHHPYSYSEDIGKQYSDSKEASIKYLDLALEEFINELKTTSILEDTLVIFTSDESHGVNNHPLGNNWGFLMVYDPEIKGPIILKELYGQNDIVPSIMDYLNISEGVYGNSIFRKYTNSRDIIFSNRYDGSIYYSNSDGELYQLTVDNSLYSVEYDEGLGIFSNDYKYNQLINDPLKDSILKYQYILNNELTYNSKENSLTIIKQSNYSLDNKTDSHTISGGQYITLPENSLVEISFDYNFNNVENLNGIVFDLKHIFDDTSKNKYFYNNLTKLEDRGYVVHRFFNEEKQNRFSFDLLMKTYRTISQPEEMNIENLTVKFLPKSKQDQVNTDFKELNFLNTRTNVIHLLESPYQRTYDEIGNMIFSGINKDLLLYGPYLNINKGKYNLQLEVKNFKKSSLSNQMIVVDIVSDGANTVHAKKEFTLEEFDNISIPFEIKDDIVSNIEFRVFVNGISQITLESMEIVRRK